MWAWAKRIKTWFGDERAKPATVPGALHDEPANGSRGPASISASSPVAILAHMTAVMHAARGRLSISVAFRALIGYRRARLGPGERSVTQELDGFDSSVSR
jgi:hypothetical protein